jgi:hypothetical protein
MKLIHDMQAHTRRVPGMTAEPRKAEVTLDSLAADVEAIRIEVTVCITLLAEIHDAMGIGYKPSPEECEPDEPF